MNAMPADWGRTASRWGRSRRTAPVVPPPGAPRPAAFCARARMSSRKSQPGGPPCEVADSATRYPVLVGPSLSRRCSRGGSVGKRISVLTCCAVLALLGSTSRLAAQGGVIRGRVTDSTGAALGRVSVTIEALGARATTDDHGDYELRSVPAGSHTVRVRLLGYVPLLVRVSVAEGQPTRQDFSLRTQPIALAPIDVVVGSRAHHTASEELAVPVDVFTREEMQQQGTTETSQVLQQLAPSVNFPRQSVTDANDIVRPFTLRGLSPDQTLVLVNGWRRHQTALVNTFPYGMAFGSSGVDMSAIPGGAIERLEVLRDGASAQYGSDAIAGVVNVVMREGKFSPYLNADAGRYVTAGVCVQVGGELAFPHHDVHDACDGVGAVLRRGPIPQHLEALDGAAGYGAHVDPARPKRHAVGEGVHEGGLMPAPAVHQHQRLVRAQATQCEWPHDVVRVGHTLPGEVHRGSELLQDLARLRRPLLLHLLAREDVHGHGELLRRRVMRPRAHDHIDGRERNRLGPGREVLSRGLPLGPAR